MSNQPPKALLEWRECEALACIAESDPRRAWRYREGDADHLFGSFTPSSTEIAITRALEREAVLTAEIKRLREALTPFADQYGYDIPRPDDFHLFGGLTLGDFRRATAALAGEVV